MRLLFLATASFRFVLTQKHGQQGSRVSDPGFGACLAKDVFVDAGSRMTVKGLSGKVRHGEV